MSERYINLAELTKRNEPLAKYIRMLQNRGRLNKYTDESGRACYKLKEYNRYKRLSKGKRGRPLKNAIKIGDNE